jgi:hypothetical protein
MAQREQSMGEAIAESAKMASATPKMQFRVDQLLADEGLELRGIDHATGNPIVYNGPHKKKARSIWTVFLRTRR